MRVRISRPLVIACGLLALVGLLAALQYRWLGEVSEAERERVRVHLQQAAADVQRDFDREITRAFITFQTSARPDADPAGPLADAYRRWQSSAAAPAIVDAVYVVRVAPDKPPTLSRLDPIASTISEVSWPPRLAAWRDRATRVAAGLPGGLRLVPIDPIESEIPAVIIGLPHVKAVGTDNRTFVTDDSGPTSIVIVSLDPVRLREDLIAPLVTRYFGADATTAYLLSVGPRDGDRAAFTSSVDGRAVRLEDADAVVSLFDLQPEEFSRLHSGGEPVREHVAITILRRTGNDVKRSVMPGTPGSGAWQLRVRHRSGSLEQIVAHSRMRNLVVSGGILMVLAAGIVLIVTYTERRQRLARQQMDFVAAVSHELRTPLAVICSAADNLADGVVADRDQVARYGALVRAEGRRLSDMVERVLAFARINARAAGSARAAAVRDRVDLGSVLDDAVSGVRAEADARQIGLHIAGERHLAVIADAHALRSALQNVIGNAVKYSHVGGKVHIDLANRSGLATIVVRDDGIGIDAMDLPHVWQPFYRGRRAIDAQIRGSGIGLGIVRQTIVDHAGSVAIASVPDAGTTVTIELPVAPRADSSVAAERATA